MIYIRVYIGRYLYLHIYIYISVFFGGNFRQGRLRLFSMYSYMCISMLEWMTRATKEHLFPKYIVCLAFNATT